MRTWVAPPACLFLLLPLTFEGQLNPAADRFTPGHRLAGIGVERQAMPDDLLAIRTDLMIQSQTFAILRDARSVPGAERISGARMQSLFRNAERQSGFPASTLAAMSYLESFGIPNAESPSGPEGIMQISEATARAMGLKVVRARRYRTTTQTKVVRGKRRTVRIKTPYMVTVRDDRLVPERAIPAAAKYLARLEDKFGGRDWAIFAYHCGEGCVSYLRSITETANGFRDRSRTVARMFFNCSPAYNHNLYEAIQAQMQRDYSPTYWFRVKRAEELLALYHANPEGFRRLAEEYRSDFTGPVRAPNRLSVWLRSTDLTFRTAADIRSDQGRRLAKAFENPDYFGYRLRTAGVGSIGADDPKNRELYLQASPAALGTLAYISFETRRLFDDMNTGEKFQPLEVTSLVHPTDVTSPGSPEARGHSSGLVFDIAYSRLPAAERECLQFVLDDLGWYGYLGFSEEGADSMHIGCSPSARDFFAQVFQDALAGTALAQSSAAEK